MFYKHVLPLKDPKVYTQYFLRSVSDLFFPDPTKALLLTDYGSSRLDKLVRAKSEVNFQLAVEPNPVHG